MIHQSFPEFSLLMFLLQSGHQNFAVNISSRLYNYSSKVFFIKRTFVLYGKPISVHCILTVSLRDLSVLFYSTSCSWLCSYSFVSFLYPVATYNISYMHYVRQWSWSMIMILPSCIWSCWIVSLFLWFDVSSAMYIAWLKLSWQLPYIYGYYGMRIGIIVNL